jgi:hypothetical protein
VYAKFRQPIRDRSFVGLSGVGRKGHPRSAPAVLASAIMLAQIIERCNTNGHDWTKRRTGHLVFW